MRKKDTGAKASTQEARHTPGPWHVDSTDACYVRAPNGSSIATMGFLSIRFWGPRRPDAEVLVNASLIAAKPRPPARRPTNRPKRVTGPDGTVYASLGEAGRVKGVTAAAISKRCRTFGSGWSIEGEPAAEPKSESFAGSRPVAVVDPSGRQFASIGEAARAHCMRRASIANRVEKGLFGWRLA